MSSPESPTTAVSSPSGVVLVGNPNVGKSVLFGLLTRTYVVVSNYPGTTVEIVRGMARFGASKLEILDTPGVNNLLPESEDEQVTRDILLAERPRCVLQVADAKNLRRSLLITVQLAEMGLPTILDLNMLDEARTRGIRVDVALLEEALGVPVVSTVAIRREGLGALRRAIEEGGRVPGVRVDYEPPIERAVERISELLPDELPVRARSFALMLLARDPALDGRLDDHVPAELRDEIESVVRETAGRFSAPLSYVITARRYAAAERLLAPVLSREPSWRRGLGAGIAALNERPGPRWAVRGLLLLSLVVFVASMIGVAGLGSPWITAAAAVGLVAGGILSDTLTTPGFGLASSVGVLYLVYLIVAGLGAGIAVDFLQETVFDGFIGPGMTWLFDRILGDPATSGAVARFFHDLFVGPYGAVTMALAYAVAIILPVVGAFFLAFGVLEDSGYLPRLAVMMNRIFRTMGLNGKAVLPMVLGLGCDTMATLTARILPTRKERVVVTLLLALAVPCSAQLGIILGILADVSVAGTIWWIGTLLLVAFVVGRLSAMLVPGETGDFLIELPPLRVPSLLNVVRKTVARMEWYLKEAVPLFFLGTMVLFLLDRVGALEAIVTGSRPLMEGLLGLPAQTSEVFLMGFLRRDYGAAGLRDLWADGGLTPTQAVVALTTVTLFIPCLAQWFVMLKERGWRMTLASTLFILPFALAVGGAMNGLFRLLGVTLGAR